MVSSPHGILVFLSTSANPKSVKLYPLVPFPQLIRIYAVQKVQGLGHEDPSVGVFRASFRAYDGQISCSTHLPRSHILWTLQGRETMVLTDSARILHNSVQRTHHCGACDRHDSGMEY